jgi:hypothetical protein
MIVSAKKISKTQLPKLIELSYFGDEELLSHYHSGEDINYYNAIIKELDYIHQASKKFELSYHKLIYKQKPIGYFVTFEGFLYSFGIEKKSRKKEVMSNWFLSVRKVLGKEFVSMLYSYNTRAVKHLERQGMAIIDEDVENQTVTLKYN